MITRHEGAIAVKSSILLFVGYGIGATRRQRPALLIDPQTGTRYTMQAVTKISQVCIDAVDDSGLTGFFDLMAMMTWLGVGIAAYGCLMRYVRHCQPNETAFRVPNAVSRV